MGRKIKALYAVIVLVAIFGIGGLLYAYSASHSVNISNGGVYNYYEASEAIVELQPTEPIEESDEVTFGAFPGGDIYQPVTFWETISLGSGKNDSTYFYKSITFANNTNTAAVFNPDFEGYNDFYLIDLWLENTSKSTSTVRIAVTTSTEEFYDKDDNDFWNHLVDDAAPTSTLMRTLGNAFGADGAAYNSETATGSQYHILNYPGSDSKVIANKLNFLINSTTNILVFASSTNDGAILSTGNTFGGKLHIIGRQSVR